MSKFKLKNHLQSLTKEQLIEVVTEAYDNSKSVKEYFDFYLQPDEKEKVKKYKAIIEKKFSLTHPDKASLRYSIARKAISELSENGFFSGKKHEKSSKIINFETNNEK